jgi:hypothetical protein
MTTPCLALPADPAAATRRFLLGAELTSEERQLNPGGVDRARRLTAIRARGTGVRRWARRLTVVVVVVAGVLGLNLIAAPSAQAFNIFGPVKHAVQDAFNSFLDQLAHAICGFVANFVHGILGYADRGLGIDFTVAWFKNNYEHMMLGGFLMGLAIMIVQCTAAALRRNPTQMLTAVAATLFGVLASFVALSLIMMISAGIDDWCAAVTGGKSIADGTQKTIKGLPDQVGAVGAILVAVLYLVFSLLLFIVLIVRRLGIFVISLFIPVYAGGLGGGWTNGMVKRATEILFVLLLSRLSIIGTFTLGESMLVGDTKGLDVEVAAISSVVVMAFAVLSPLGVMYLVAFADGLLVGQIASSAHHGRSGLTSARNQTRGHDGHGNRTALGRLTGRGRDRVRRDQQGGIGGGRGVIAAARRAAQRVRPARTPGAHPGARSPSDTTRHARARGARRATSGIANPRTTPPTPKNRGTTGRRPGTRDSAG